MTEAEFIIIEFRWYAVCVASLLLIQSDFRVQEQNKIEKKSATAIHQMLL